MFGALDISTSGLVAQRILMDTVAGNLANAHTAGFQRRVPLFSVGASAEAPQKPGVHVSAIVKDPRPGQMVYRPEHPMADSRGYVEMSNVNELEEMINAMMAARAYEANITAANATKTMMNAALRLLG